MTLLALAVVRVALGFVILPVPVLPVANMLVAIVFLGTPILALFYGARQGWTPLLALIFVVVGAALQAGATYMVIEVFHHVGLGALVCAAIAQIGLPMWCVGLGALLATLVKDKNIIIPIAIFLAVYDMFLVLTPVGPTQQMLRHAPKVFESVAATIPAIRSVPTGGTPQVGAEVGPADFVFLSMFFIALFRFRMRTDLTLRWVIPVLMVYLLAVGVLGLPLPALVPIGITVLIVNWPEFKMNRDEKLSTALVAALGIGLLIWGATRPKPPAEPLPTETSQAVPGRADSPGPGQSNRHP